MSAEGYFDGRASVHREEAAMLRDQYARNNAQRTEAVRKATLEADEATRNLTVFVAIALPVFVLLAGFIATVGIFN